MSVSFSGFLRQYSDDVAQVEDWVQRRLLKPTEAYVRSAVHRDFRPGIYYRTELKWERIWGEKHFVLADHDSPSNVSSVKRNKFSWNDSMKAFSPISNAKTTVFFTVWSEGYSHAEISSCWTSVRTPRVYCSPCKTMVTNSMGNNWRMLYDSTLKPFITGWFPDKNSTSTDVRAIKRKSILRNYHSPSSPTEIVFSTVSPQRCCSILSV